MKTRSITLLSTSMLALCGMLLPSTRVTAAEKDTLNASDVRFIKDAAAEFMSKEKLAELGVKRASKPEVKAYAEMVVTDHNRSNEVLSELAVSKGVELPAVIEPAYAKTIQKLEKSGKAEFDRKFLAEMVAGHRMCLSNFEEASGNANDADVKAFANGMLPTLVTHLRKSKELSLAETADEKPAPDNTARNQRDRDGGELTPIDQGNSKKDTEITARIRREILAEKDMSVNAQNVKIITLNGMVTLRGPVANSEEKRIISEIAGRVVKADHVECQLEVK